MLLRYLVAGFFLFFITVPGALFCSTDLNSQQCIITNQNMSHDKETRVLTFDWDKVWIGSAQYTQGPTGCTVFRFPDRLVNAVVDIRGSAAASIFTNDLQNGMTALDAIVFAGGSLLGLEAATGVTHEIFRERNYQCGWGKMPLVAGSVLFDWVDRTSPLYPDKILGSVACRAAAPNRFVLGRHGAGINTRVAKLFGRDYMVHGGQGAAFKKFGDVKIAVFTVVNALGAVYGSDGVLRHGYFDRVNNVQLSAEALLQKVYPFTPSGSKEYAPQSGNTTLSLIVTNLDLPVHEMQLLARQVHNSFSQTIRPYGTQQDGDTLYFVSTREIKNTLGKDEFFIDHLGMLMTPLVQEAIFAAFEPKDMLEIGVPKS